MLWRRRTWTNDAPPRRASARGRFFAAAGHLDSPARRTALTTEIADRLCCTSCMDAPGDASILESSVRQVHSCIVAALQAADDDTRTGPKFRGTQEVQLVYPLHDRLPLLSLRPCPRRPAQALTPGNPSVGSRRDRRHPVPSSSAAPMRCAPLAMATATSFGGLVASASHEPVAHRFAHRTTDMAPMLCHADPCRASPCRPCCLLLALNRARPRSRALSSPGAKAAEAVPTPGMLSLESSSSFVVSLLLGDLPVQTPVAVGRPRCTG